MSLLDGFASPVAQAQQTFRLILKALSEPGVTVRLTDGPQWPPLNAATTAALLTLADGETPLLIEPALNSEQVLTNLRFHTGAPQASSAAQAAFAVYDPRLQEADLHALPHGDELAPEQGATLIVQLDDLENGAPLRLRGPGIAHSRTIAPPLPEALRRYLLARPQPFPLGLDVILTCGDALLAIPRTTHLEEC
ncbi:phosphonate C-P lyase system protein PhnH [Serratia sp. JUb9]|uniref:phosphonate C-P lyase system protein PhnH n=1 Tax=Serratia sp. JUb9 TaxID=2724469 RepID=UPI00164ED918|nr:phosphonate C-P lyase system protein PhnH [Serratia sp. JUb9]QNK32066.1 phosphonate C-P lyase system protein PhnH [Serratia sp. JUb9]